MPDFDVFNRNGIFAKSVNSNGLVDAFTDDIDTIDVNGFSDAIQAIGAKTAKFSGGATMQAISGLRIGMTRLKINTGIASIRSRAIIPVTIVTNPENAIDGDLNNNTGFSTVAGVMITVDFGSIISNTINAKVRHASNSTFVSILEISTDNSIWTTATVDSGTNPNTTNSDTTFTYDGSIQSYRFARIRVITTSSIGITIFEIFEDPPTGTVTVKVRSSVTIDSTDGTVIIPDQVINDSSQLTFTTELLLTGNPIGDFVTLEIVSFSGPSFDVTLSDITSIKEES